MSAYMYDDHVSTHKLGRLFRLVLWRYHPYSDARLQDDLNLSDESDDDAKREITESNTKLPLKK